MHPVLAIEIAIGIRFKWQHSMHFMLCLTIANTLLSQPDLLAFLPSQMHAILAKIKEPRISAVKRKHLNVTLSAELQSE